MCLDSKLLVVAEMFPSWPHKNIPSPLQHHASVEKRLLLWSYKKHLSITASGKTERGEEIARFSREVLGSTWGIISFYQRRSSRTSSLFFTVTQISCKSIPFFPEERAGTRFLSTVVPLQQSGAPAKPPADLPSPCYRAIVAGRELFNLHCSLPLFVWAKRCKMHPSKGLQWATPTARSFPEDKFIAAGIGSTPSLSERWPWCFICIPVATPGPLLPLKIYLDANTRTSCHHWCPSPAVWINKNLFLDQSPPASAVRAPVCKRTRH